MILNIISFLTGRNIVWLEDFEGELYRTLERKHPISGEKCAYAYWPNKIRLVILNDDGTVSGGIYIEKWAYE